MTDDVRKYIYGALIVFVVGVFAWVSFVFVNACGLTLTCKRGTLAVYRTPVPTLIPATLPLREGMGSGAPAVSDQCRVSAVDLIGAWVEGGSPETKPFQFVDASGTDCEATFNDVKPLFVEANFWSPGSFSCVSCHSVDLTVSPAQLDLSSYRGILDGSRRADPASKGTDILGAGNWKSSLLHEFLTTSKPEVPGHTDVSSDLMISVGKPLPAPPRTVATPTQTPVK